MTQVAPPRCAPVDLGELIEFKLLPHGTHPQVPGPHHNGGDFRLGDDGVFRHSPYGEPVSGCASRAAMLALVQRVERGVPERAWRAIAARDAEHPPSDWYGDGRPLVRVVRAGRSGRRAADVAWGSEIDDALADFLARNPSHEGRARERFNGSTAAAASLRAWWVVCGHCGNGELTASVREDGWFVYERSSYDGSERFAGRFEPAQARAFLACLRDRGAMGVRLAIDQFSFGGPDACPSTRSWHDATGFELPASSADCGASHTDRALFGLE
jgi:hypothetical protein